MRDEPGLGWLADCEEAALRSLHYGSLSDVHFGELHSDGKLSPPSTYSRILFLLKNLNLILCPFECWRCQSTSAHK